MLICEVSMASTAGTRAPALPLVMLSIQMVLMVTETASVQQASMTASAAEAPASVEEGMDYSIDDDASVSTAYAEYDGVEKSVHEAYNYPTEAEVSRRKALRRKESRWPGAVVPFEIASDIDSVSPTARSVIAQAMAHWAEHTCVRFVPYLSGKHKNWVQIEPGQWCSAHVGMIRSSPQKLRLAGGCFKFGTVVHELGHTLGWVHEHTRPDRDDHVSVSHAAAGNINYMKNGHDVVDTFGVPYDHSSIMHYAGGVISALDSKKKHLMGQRRALSFHDIQLANIMYNCSAINNCDTRRIRCSSGGYIGPRCRCKCPDGTENCTVSTAVVHPPRVNNGGSSRRCVEWTVYAQSYRAGRKSRVSRKITLQDCKAQCKARTRPKCIGIDYFKDTQLCYLTAPGCSRRLSSSWRSSHYSRNVNCDSGLQRIFG